VSALVSETDAAVRVPACPEWSVKDVLAHVTGVCADILAGRLDGVATQVWTQRQVDERRSKTVSEIVAEWNEAAPQVEAICSNFGGAEVQWLMDTITHEHDIRGALSKPGARDDEAIALGLDWLTKNIGGEITAMRVETTEGDEHVMGAGEPQATVRGPRFEMLRALTGRRSKEQIAAFDWKGDFSCHLEAFRQGPFEIAAESIRE
jgi:uncharacterized protein (TIGR03083 family)